MRPGAAAPLTAGAMARAMVTGRTETATHRAMVRATPTGSTDMHRATEMPAAAMTHRMTARATVSVRTATDMRRVTGMRVVREMSRAMARVTASGRMAMAMHRVTEMPDAPATRRAATHAMVTGRTEMVMHRGAGRAAMLAVQRVIAGVTVNGRTAMAVRRGMPTPAMRAMRSGTSRLARMRRSPGATGHVVAAFMTRRRAEIAPRHAPHTSATEIASAMVAKVVAAPRRVRSVSKRLQRAVSCGHVRVSGRDELKGR